jgi:hypothetical protein
MNSTGNREYKKLLTASVVIELKFLSTFQYGQFHSSARNSYLQSELQVNE